MNDRVPLSFLLTQNADEQPAVEPIVPFAGLYGEAPKVVTAVLERTAVLAEPSDRYERLTVRHDQVLVDPAVISWRTRTAEYDGSRLLTNSKPGEGRAHVHRQPNRSPWRGNREQEVDVRERSDERARQNQADIAAQKQRELAAHRRRQPKRIQEEVTSMEQQPTNTNPAASAGTATVELKHCKRCGQDKPREQFPSASGIYGGYCDVCTPLEKAERAAGGGTKRARLKRGKAINGKRRGKKVKLGEAVVLASSGPHDKVVKLLERRDALRAQLASVQAEIAEAVAG